KCLWITGKVYVGKSTIAIKMAKELLDRKILFAQFFIARNITSIDPNQIFPILAWQLAERSPLAAMVIKKNLDEMSSDCLQQLSKEQGRALFIEPLKVIAQYESKVAIIIDGVDE
ncbi:hypothetical protein B0H13DRAFT_1574374, partial [Mycena leptocephala]